MARIIPIRIISTRKMLKWPWQKERKYRVHFYAYDVAISVVKKEGESLEALLEQLFDHSVKIVEGAAP